MGFVEDHTRVTQQNAATQNAAYDAFVDKLDFSSGKYETRVRREGGGSKALARSDEDRTRWVWSAKLFAKDVIEKYGPGKYCVSVVGPGPETGVIGYLCSLIVEG